MKKGNCTKNAVAFLYNLPIDIAEKVWYNQRLLCERKEPNFPL